jgi:hypothetical protein
VALGQHPGNLLRRQQPCSVSACGQGVSSATSIGVLNSLSQVCSIKLDSSGGWALYSGSMHSAGMSGTVQCMSWCLFDFVKLTMGQWTAGTGGGCCRSDMHSPLSSSLSGDLGRNIDLTAHMVAAVHLIMACVRWG